MTAYYNEIDKKAAEWLRQLIKNGLIADGVVDERSIVEVEPSDLKGFTQHHFFSGIGGWSYALRIAGWADDKPVCTASLPCQPFSIAGAGKGVNDERHLLPHFIELVKQCNFRTIFGEQVPGAIKHGWLDDLCFEMERENYAVGSIVLTAAGAGAPHIRQRMYWVADSIGTRSKEQPGNRGISRETSSDDSRKNFERSGGLCGMVHTNGTGSQQGREFTEASGYWDSIESTGGYDSPEELLEQCIESGDFDKYEQWKGVDWLYCKDDKWRPIKPGIKPLVDGVSGRVVRGGDTSKQGVEENSQEAYQDYNNTQEARVMRLKGYGNAIVPQVAAQFAQQPPSSSVIELL